jgi:hypothetical protein
VTALDLLAALALLVAGALITRSVYRLGLTAGIRLGYGAGRGDAFAEARRLIQQSAAAVDNGGQGNGK